MINLESKAKKHTSSIPSFDKVRLFGDDFCWIPVTLWNSEQNQKFSNYKKKCKLRLKMGQSQGYRSKRTTESDSIYIPLLLQTEDGQIGGWAEVECIASSFSITYLFADFNTSEQTDRERFLNLLISYCIFALSSDQVRLVNPNLKCALSDMDYKEIFIPIEIKRGKWSLEKALCNEISAQDWKNSDIGKKDRIKLLYIISKK